MIIKLTLCDEGGKSMWFNMLHLHSMARLSCDTKTALWMMGDHCHDPHHVRELPEVIMQLIHNLDPATYREGVPTTHRAPLK